MCLKGEMLFILTKRSITFSLLFIIERVSRDKQSDETCDNGGRKYGAHPIPRTNVKVRKDIRSKVRDRRRVQGQ